MYSDYHSPLLLALNSSQTLTTPVLDAGLVGRLPPLRLVHGRHEVLLAEAVVEAASAGTSEKKKIQANFTIMWPRTKLF